MKVSFSKFGEIKTLASDKLNKDIPSASLSHCFNSTVEVTIGSGFISISNEVFLKQILCLPEVFLKKYLS